MDHQQRPPPNAIFYGEQGSTSTINIHDGNFVQHNYPQPRQGFDAFKRLQDRVATTAFDSAQTVDAPKCHPNTRLTILDEIMTWILLTVPRTQWMLWLNGAAGAGKSAIARSIVARCLAQNITIARFFFFCTDPTRNSIQPVVATLAYQLIQQLPDLFPIIIGKIESNPLIFTMSLETQLGHLIFDPLRQLHRKIPLSVVVLLLDGIDECDGHVNQTDVISLISGFLSARDIPIIAFFGSRLENQLQHVFRSHKISPSLLQLALDDDYLSDADIRLFLNDNFEDIKHTHPFGHHIAEDWPDPTHVEEIVEKSSGQFIYASSVVTFISSPRKHPSQQLDIVCGLQPPGNLTPFAQLDALYLHIFSQIENTDCVLLILAWRIFGRNTNSSVLSDFLGMNVDNICVILADLTSILVYEHDRVRFLHASLSDFLLDQGRSRGYYFEKTFWCTRLSIHCLTRVSAEKTTDAMIYLLLHLSGDFLPYAEKNSKIYEDLLSMEYRYVDATYCRRLSDYLHNIQQLDFEDGGRLYNSQLNRITRYAFENMGDPVSQFRNLMGELRRMHNISAIITQLEDENASEL